MQVFASESERLAFLLEAEAGLYPVPLSALGIAEVDDGQTQAKEHPNTAPISFIYGDKKKGGFSILLVFGPAIPRSFQEEFTKFPVALFSRRRFSLS